MNKKLIFEIILILLVIILSVMLFIEYRKFDNYSKLSNQNITALTDSIKIFKNKYNEYVFSKASLSLEMEDLKKVNSKLYEEIKKSDNKIITLSNLSIIYKKQLDSIKSINDVQTIPNDNTINFKDGQTKRIDWSFSDVKNEDTLQILGHSIFKVALDSNLIIFSKAISSLDEFKFNANIKVGVQFNDKKDVYEFFTKTKNDNISFTFDSYVDPKLFYKKEKNWDFGFMSGIGMGLDFKNSNIILPNLFIGIGITYKIFSF